MLLAAIKTMILPVTLLMMVIMKVLLMVSYMEKVTLKLVVCQKIMTIPVILVVTATMEVFLQRKKNCTNNDMKRAMIFSIQTMCYG